MYNSTLGFKSVKWWFLHADYAIIFGVGCMLQFAVKISGMTMSNLLLQRNCRLLEIHSICSITGFPPHIRLSFIWNRVLHVLAWACQITKKENFPNGKTHGNLPSGRNCFRLFRVGLFTFSVPKWNFPSWHLSLSMMLVDIEVALWFSSVQIRLTSVNPSKKVCQPLPNSLKYR